MFTGMCCMRFLRETDHSTFDVRCSSNMRQEHRTLNIECRPGGVEAISRGLIRLGADETPGKRPKHDNHPAGVTAAGIYKIVGRNERLAGRLENWMSALTCDILRPLAGSKGDMPAYRGYRSAQPPANGCDPFGVTARRCW